MYFAPGCIFDILKNYILYVDNVLRAGLNIHGYHRRDQYVEHFSPKAKRPQSIQDSTSFTFQFVT